MPRVGRKRRHHEEAEASNDEDVASSKKVKTTDAAETVTDIQKEMDDDGHAFWSLGGNRRIMIQDFKGKTYLNIREFYNDKGTLRPGTKGIVLPVDQWNSILSILPSINSELQSQGHTIFDIPVDASSASTSKKESKKKTEKMNIEATSDEEDLD